MDNLITLLKEKGYTEGIDFKSFFDPKAVHNEHAWADRVWRPLQFLFGK
jgi:hypothetical protein